MKGFRERFWIIGAKRVAGFCALGLLAAACGHSGNEHFRVHPYLLLASTTEAALKFELREDLELSIDGGPVESYAAGRLYEVILGPGEAARAFTVRMERAAPGGRETIFERAVGPGGGGTGEEMVFAVISDTHGARRSFPGLRDFFAGKPPEESPGWLLHLGDIVKQGGREESWIRLLGRESLSEWPLVVAVGNHDYRGAEKARRSGTAPRYFKRYLRRQNDPEGGWLTYDFPRFKLVVLNSNFFRLDRRRRELQLEWLEEELSQARLSGLPVIAAWHHAVYSSNRWKASSDEIDYLKGRVIPLLKDYDVSLILAGHSHVYERSYRDGIHYVNIGHWGYRGLPVLRASNPYRRRIYSFFSTLAVFRVDGESIGMEVFNRRGRLIDRLEIPSGVGQRYHSRVE